MSNYNQHLKKASTLTYAEIVEMLEMSNRKALQNAITSKDKFTMLSDVIGLAMDRAADLLMTTGSPDENGYHLPFDKMVYRFWLLLSLEGANA